MTLLFSKVGIISRGKPWRFPSEAPGGRNPLPIGRQGKARRLWKSSGGCYPPLVLYHGACSAANLCRREQTTTRLTMKIVQIRGFEVFDSRGNPTVEAEVVLENGVRANALVPS